MKKGIKKVLICVLILIILIGLYMVFKFVIKREISQISEFKKLYNYNDTSSVSISYINFYREEVKQIDKDKVIRFLNTLEHEKVTEKMTFLDIFGTNNSSKSYGLAIKYDNMSFDVIISENTISIGKKKYKTERNLINVLSNILTDYEEYTIN